MAGALKILVYEHTSGGGYAGEQLPSSILSEGYGMLRCLTSDLSRAGHRTVTFIDSRLRNNSSLLGADQITSISSQSQLASTFSKSLRSVDAAFVIAPEADGILEAFVRQIEESGVLSMNCSADSIHSASDKALAFGVLRNAGVRVPETCMVDLREDSELSIMREMGGPFILKPLHGGGCGGLSLVASEDDLKMALAKVKKTSGESFAMAQEVVRGIDASVNLIRTSDATTPVTLNQQFITISTPSFESVYLGGLVPLEHEIADQALEAAVRSIECIPGLSGYVSVDMVLTEEGPFVIEINPRLTTSYIGARKVLKLNLAEAIVQAVPNGGLTPDVDTSGYAVFYKVHSGFPAQEIRREPFQLDVITPPLQSTHAGDSLILIYTPTLAMAKKAQSLLTEAETN